MPNGAKILPSIVRLISSDFLLVFPPNFCLYCGLHTIYYFRKSQSKKSVDSRNFKKWGRSPTTAQNVVEELKSLGDDFMIKFKLMKNTFSVY